MTLTIRDIEDRYQVRQHTVLGWIRSGELKAINVRRSGSKRPSWRITEEALQEFEERRVNGTPLGENKKRKRRKPVVNSRF